MTVEQAATGVSTRVREGVLYIELDRPQRRNAIDPALRDALATELDRAARDSAVRALVLSGAGGNFCAGGDLGSFEDLHDQLLYRHVSHALTALIESIERLEKPVIAAIDGVATGAGLTLALACDWRIAAPGARFLFREGALNLVPTHGGITRLVKLLGLARAKQVLLGGDDVDGREAVRLGLAMELAEPDELLDSAHARALKMCRRAPMSFGAAKRLAQLAADSDQRSAVLAESLAQGTLLVSADHQEGLAAARERRPPKFSGR